MAMPATSFWPCSVYDSTSARGTKAGLDDEVNDRRYFIPIPIPVRAGWCTHRGNGARQQVPDVWVNAQEVVNAGQAVLLYGIITWEGPPVHLPFQAGGRTVGSRAWGRGGRRWEGGG